MAYQQITEWWLPEEKWEGGRLKTISFAAYKNFRKSKNLTGQPP